MDNVEKIVKVNRLADETIGMQVITFHDIGLCVGSSQNHDGDASEFRVAFDLLQHFSSVPFGEVEVEQNEVRPWFAGVRPLVFQEIQCFDAIGNYFQGDVFFSCFESLLSQADVSGVVFYQKNRIGSGPVYHCHRLGYKGLAKLLSVCYRNVWERKAQKPQPGLLCYAVCRKPAASIA